VEGGGGKRLLTPEPIRREDSDKRFHQEEMKRESKKKSIENRGRDKERMSFQFKLGTIK